MFKSKFWKKLFGSAYWGGDGAAAAVEGFSVCLDASDLSSLALTAADASAVTLDAQDDSTISLTASAAECS